MIEHLFEWKLTRFFFLVPQFQLAIAAGAVALILMTPAAFTSWESLQKSLGKHWRQIHLLSVPALLLSAIHTVLIGSHYLGSIPSWGNKLATVLLGIVTLGVLLVRTKFFWSKLAVEKFYVPPNKSR
jgi:DMSO/TMAO reductase YedYZ heme-binding membrane subunit